MIATLREALEAAEAYAGDDLAVADLRLGLEAAEAHEASGSRAELAQVLDAFEARLFDLCSPTVWRSPLWDHLYAVRSIQREVSA